MTVHRPGIRREQRCGWWGQSSKSDSSDDRSAVGTDGIELGEGSIVPHQSRSPSNAQHPPPAKQGGGDTVRNAKLNCTLKYSDWVK